jgi:hypothetical protein
VLIPKKITVGKTTYTVIKTRHARTKNILGTIDYTNGIIWLATHDAHGNEIESEEMSDTFWHEITHAVLHNMKHPLRDDEKFVSMFGTLLADSVESAKL